MKKIVFLFIMSISIVLKSYGQTRLEYFPNKMTLQNLLSDQSNSTPVPHGTIRITQDGSNFTFKMFENVSHFQCRVVYDDQYDEFYEGYEKGTQNRVQIGKIIDNHSVMIILHQMGDTNTLLYFVPNQNVMDYSTRSTPTTPRTPNTPKTPRSENYLPRINVPYNSSNLQTITEARLKSSPSPVGNEIGIIPRNVSVNILSKENGYYKVRYGAYEGYVSELFVK